MPSYVAGRPHTGRLLSDEEILRRYAEGMDSFTLGLQAGCSSVTVLTIVRGLGGAVRTAGSSQRRALLISDAEIIQLYQAGLSGTVVADRAGCAAGTIYKLLKANGVPCRRGYDKSKAARQAAHRARQSEKGKLSAEAGRRRKAATCERVDRDTQ
jgi:hypothetical protein